MTATRVATRDDIPELVRVINLAYRVEDFFIKGDRIAADEVAQRLETRGARFIVIDSDDRAALVAAVYVDINESRGHFALLSVDPAFQGKGLARTLLNAVEKHCMSAGCEWLDLEIVNLREELPAFYSAFGFSPLGTAEFPKTEKLSRDAHLLLWTKRLGRSE